jgi:hypothetical protein
MAFATDGTVPYSLRRQARPKGLSESTPQKLIKDAFIVPLPAETKRDPQYMRVSEPSITLHSDLELVLRRVRYPIDVIGSLIIRQRAGH